MVLQEITENLTETYKDSDDVSVIVEKAKNTVLERELRRIHEVEGRSLMEKGITEGRIKAFYEVAETNTRLIMSRRNRITQIISIGKMVIGIVFIILLIFIAMTKGPLIISKSLKTEFYGYDIYDWLPIIGLAVSFIVFFVFEPIKSLINKRTYEDIKRDEYEKLIKKCNVNVPIMADL